MGNKKKKNNRFNSKKKNKGSKKGPEPSTGSSASSFHFDGGKFNHGSTSSNTDGNIEAVTGSYYDIYKEATTKFYMWMKRTLPNSRIVYVNDLMKGIQEIMEEKIEIPKHIINTLSTSIKYRGLFTETRYGKTGGDEGHKYMTDTLAYCHQVLRRGRRLSRKNAISQDVTRSYVDDEKQQTSSEEKQNDGIGGRFEPLLLNDKDNDSDEEDTDDIQDCFEDRKPPSLDAPKAPERSKYHIVEDLINGDDRFQAIAILRTMEDLMGIVDNQYKTLKNTLRGREKCRKSNLMQLLLECTVVTNMAIENVHVAENSLMTNHPHITSFYHVLALVYLPEEITRIENLAHPSQMTKKNRHMGLEFVAEVVACACQPESKRTLRNICSQFAPKLGISAATLTEEAFKIHQKSNAENQKTLDEKRLRFETAQRLDAETAASSSLNWFADYTFIGGDRSIVNTQTITEQATYRLKGNADLAMEGPKIWENLFGRFDPPPTRIRGDLNHMLEAGILPQLYASCMYCPMDKLPETFPLVPILALLGQYEKGSRSRPVPIALTFGLHAMLTSILVLEGDGDRARLAKMIKQSFHKLFVQFDGISDESKSPGNIPVFYDRVISAKALVRIAGPLVAQTYHEPVVKPLSPEEVVLWNPVIGGQLMLYGVYIASIFVGSYTVDSAAQLRLALHLYNAVRQADPTLDVPILNKLHRTFSETKLVWPSSPPEKGSYEKLFWVGLGMDPLEASRQVKPGLAHLENTYPKSRKITRDTGKIVAGEYSISYKKLVKRDFADDQDTVTEAQNKKERHDDSFVSDLLTRVNITRESMIAEEDFVLANNIPVIGAILCEFTNDLAERMGWDKEIKKFVADNPKHTRKGKLFCGREMKGFHASDYGWGRQRLASLCAAELSKLDDHPGNGIELDDSTKEISKFMREYFDAIPEERYRLFVDIESEDEYNNNSKDKPHDSDEMMEYLENLLQRLRSKDKPEGGWTELVGLI